MKIKMILNAFSGSRIVLAPHQFIDPFGFLGKLLQLEWSRPFRAQTSGLTFNCLSQELLVAKPFRSECFHACSIHWLALDETILLEPKNRFTDGHRTHSKLLADLATDQSTARSKASV